MPIRVKLYIFGSLLDAIRWNRAKQHFELCNRPDEIKFKRTCAAKYPRYLGADQDCLRLRHRASRTGAEHGYSLGDRACSGQARTMDAADSVCENPSASRAIKCNHPDAISCNHATGAWPTLHRTNGRRFRASLAASRNAAAWRNSGARAERRAIRSRGAAQLRFGRFASARGLGQLGDFDQPSGGRWRTSRSAETAVRLAARAVDLHSEAWWIAIGPS